MEVLSLAYRAYIKLRLNVVRYKINNSFNIFTTYTLINDSQ
jgi:hypothetical protein